MDLTVDPACEYETWADALGIGQARNEANFLWLEDPYKNGGGSMFAHRHCIASIRNTNSYEPSWCIRK